jgi:hypothetical protein
MQFLAVAFFHFTRNGVVFLGPFNSACACILNIFRSHMFDMLRLKIFAFTPLPRPPPPRPPPPPGAKAHKWTSLIISCEMYDKPFIVVS